MEPILGWAGLSRSALKRAEAQLVGDSEGVRDELGILSLHTGYANRFFPGTSVQQTRLRYTLFVPWLINNLLGQRAKIRAGQVRSALEKAELYLARRLPDIDGQGTIGRRMAKKNLPVSIPPSQSYWVALREWGIVNPNSNGLSASRSELFARWDDWSDQKRRRFSTDDEGQLLYAPPRLFRSDLPDVPIPFRSNKPLDFSLQSKEKTFLRTRMLDTRREKDDQPSFLAALVRSRANISADQLPWTPSVMKHADAADRHALRRAKFAAALSVCTRAAYLAAVEAICQRSDGVSVGQRHREHLASVVDEYGEDAQRLSISDLTHDGVGIGSLAEVLEHIQDWLSQGKTNPTDRKLLDSMSRSERRRKGVRRAKLTKSTSGREARDSWVLDEVPVASPINYRWHVVCQFLRDLQD